jgi:L-ascorbate metabolism protein UlaG (beta-lactamase superfamily)
LFGGARRKPRAPIPTFDPRPAWSRPADTTFRLTWLGHSTLLLELDGFRILTDPVFGERVSPVSFAGPKRFHPVPVSIAQLPPLDAVLLSHDHFDHLCAGSMAALAGRDVTFVTALGVGARLEACGILPARIVELDWHEHIDLFGSGLRFTAAPAQHFSGRGLGDRNETLWASWIIRTDHHRVFFSGDTGLFPDMASIGAKYGPFDLTMLEVGAFHPAWGDIHLGPENALRAHALLGGGTLLPVHWGTFDLALHAWDDPAETLFERAKADGTRLLLPRLGVPTEPARGEEVAPWWRAL